MCTGFRSRFGLAGTKQILGEKVYLNFGMLYFQTYRFPPNKYFSPLIGWFLQTNYVKYNMPLINGGQPWGQPGCPPFIKGDWKIQASPKIQFQKAP